MGEKRSLAVLAVMCEQVLGLSCEATFCQVRALRPRAFLEQEDARLVSLGLL